MAIPFDSLRRARTWLLGLLVMLHASACASTPAAFSAKYPDNVEEDLSALLDRLNAAPPRSDTAIGVGVTSAPVRVYAYDLAARRVLWQTPATPRFAPLLAGDTVLTQEGKQVIGRELKSGTKRFAVDAGDMTLNGADGDDNSVVAVLTSGVGTFAKSRVLLLRSGAVSWSRDLDAPVGAPALVGNVVLVPWSNQYLSALTLEDGDEIARLRVRDGVIAHAFAQGDKVYTGSQHGVTQIGPSIIGGALKAGPYLAAPTKDLPGRPQFLRDVYSPSGTPSPESAQNRIRLTWLPAAGDGKTWLPAAGDGKTLKLAGDNLYLVFYRFVFALDPNTLDLHWMYAHEHDLVGARAQTAGLVIADVEGEVRYLSASSGKSLWFEKNGLPSVDIELPTEGGSIGAAPDDSAPDASLVRQQLMAAAQDSDARLVPMRLLAIDLLAKLDDPEATANLLGLCEDERTTAPVRKAACTALRDRTTGTEAIIAALQRHAAYLEGTSPPPVGALAKAAAQQKVAAAVPLLVAHLKDPATTPQTLAPIVTALADLGDQSAAEPLADFLRTYHADPIDEHVARALELIPAALVKLLGPAAHDPLEPIAKDNLGNGTVRDRARSALAQLDDQAKAGEKNEDAAKLAEQQEAEKLEHEAKGNELMPSHITVDLVKQVLAPVREKLQACVQSAVPELFQARLVLVIEDSQVLMVSVLPETVQSCIEPLVRAQTFPATRISKRERISYTVKRY